jgi:phosphoglycerate kinase
MGVFEWDKFRRGSSGMLNALARATDSGATTIIGGGDSASFVKSAGGTKLVSHISTGGGASLELLEGKNLPGIVNLTDMKDLRTWYS